MALGAYFYRGNETLGFAQLNIGAHENQVQICSSLSPLLVDRHNRLHHCFFKGSMFLAHFFQILGIFSINIYSPYLYSAMLFLIILLPYVKSVMDNASLIQ